MSPESTEPLSQISTLKDSLPFLLGRRDVSAAQTKFFAALWTIIGLLVLFTPYMLTLANPLWQTICSVLGAFILSSGAIGTLNSYFLRQVQMEETRAVLRESLDRFENNLHSSIVSSIQWIGNIDDVGIKAVYHTMPRMIIKEAINNARNGHIRFLFLSYATINEFEEEFRKALEHGCKIEIIVADPNNNCVIEFAESSRTYKMNKERKYAEICISKLEDIKIRLPEDYRDNFSFITYTSPPSIVVVDVLDRIWFGILWCHRESFHGPWFEVQGQDKVIPKWVVDHIDALKSREEAHDSTSL